MTGGFSSHGGVFFWDYCRHPPHGSIPVDVGLGLIGRLIDRLGYDGELSLDVRSLVFSLGHYFYSISPISRTSAPTSHPHSHINI